jgi:hypothetical protein
MKKGQNMLVLAQHKCTGCGGCSKPEQRCKECNKYDLTAAQCF